MDNWTETRDPMERTQANQLANLLKGHGSIIQEVYSILEDEEKQDALVEADIRSSLRPRVNELEGLAAERLFGLEAIRKTCIRYRLRFLPSGRFKGPIPEEAVRAVRALERQVGRPVRGFMIMAPSGHFELCDSQDDPMLFIPVGNDNYYLIHRWGRDMAPVRGLMSWPTRSWWHLAATVLMACLLLGALVPTAWITGDPQASWWGAYRVGIIFWATMVGFAVVSYGWFITAAEVSPDAWNSKTFN